MTLYKIENEITLLIDPDTGEVSDFDAWQKLQMDRETKIENTLLYCKNLAAESNAIENEINALAERKGSVDRTIASLHKHLETALAGETFKTAKVEVKYRKSKAVEIADELDFISWAQTNNRDDLLSYKQPTIAKKAIGDLIKEGSVIPFAQIVERNKMRII